MVPPESGRGLSEPQLANYGKLRSRKDPASYIQTLSKVATAAAEDAGGGRYLYVYAHLVEKGTRLLRGDFLRLFCRAAGGTLYR